MSATYSSGPRPPGSRGSVGRAAGATPVPSATRHTGTRRPGSKSANAERVQVFVVCTPGLEQLTLAEVTRQGVANPKALHGGIAGAATWPQMWSLNLHVRTATRILVRVARFESERFDSLQRVLRAIDWAAWLPTERGLRVSVTSSGSKLFHTDAVAERVLDVVPHEEDSPDDEPVNELFLRIIDNDVTVSLNTSGDPLYRRGWRTEVGKAPMRETLAAALILSSGWDGKAPLVDPFCGSGTIPIEAALISRRVPPGRQRQFGFMDWPTFDAARWKRLLAAGDADVLDRAVVIVGSDRDEGAIAAATANAGRAGVGDAVSFTAQSVSALEPPSARNGWLVTNPPYGHRVGDDDLRNLYDRFAGVLNTRFAGWNLGIVNSETSPPLKVSLADPSSTITSNGGIPITLRSGRVTGGSVESR